MPKRLKILLIDDFEQNQVANIDSLSTAINKAGIQADFINLDEQAKLALISAIEAMSPEPKINHNPKEWFEKLSVLHGVDIMFIDYQLKYLQGHAWLTAEDIAGIIRAFGYVPVVIILNRYQEVDFDLTLTQAFGTAADLHLNVGFLSNSKVWLSPVPIAATDTNVNNFRPWLWPNLFRLVDDVDNCRRELENVDLNCKVLDFLEFSPDKVRTLSRTALGYLYPTSRSPETVTFKEFLEHGCSALQADLRKVLLDNIEDPEIHKAAIRVLVSELRRWLLTRVVSVQDILIDLPHLAVRVPWLLKGDINLIETWNAAVSFDSLDAFQNVVEKYKYPKINWISRITLWIDPLQDDEDVNGAFEEYAQIQSERFSFLEDFSTFVPSIQAEDFTSAFDSIWATRSISKQAFNDGQIKYAPKVRLI